MDKLEDKSYSKLQSTFRLTGPLLIVRRSLALKQIQLFRPWSAFSFLNTLFALLFMLPSSLSAPSSTFYVERGSTEQMSSIWKNKTQRNPGAFLLCLLLFPNHFHHPSHILQSHPFLPALCSLAALCRHLRHLQQVWQAGGLWWDCCIWLVCTTSRCLNSCGGTGSKDGQGETHSFCSCPDSCCYHTSKHSLVQAPQCIPQPWCFLCSVTRA